MRALENGSDAHDLAQGNGRHLVAEGLRAVCLQHEIDHLDGILFIDRISRRKRSMYVRRRKKQLRAEREEGVKRAHGRGL